MKIWKEREFNKEIEKALINSGKGKLLARLLAQRGVTNENVNSFLECDYKGLTSPFTLNDMSKAVEVFNEVYEKKGFVAVIGDYDCDGITSSLMVKELCKSLKLKCKVFLPSRLEHGYGLNPKTVATFSETFKDKVPDLLFVLDCGMNNSDQIDVLRKELKVPKIIVIDHHLGAGSGMSTNADALITWHLSEGHSEMCTCGEVFQFIRGLKTKIPQINPIEFITYSALGTIADISPIVANNRIIVRNGLTSYAINHIPSHGLQALMKSSRILAPSLTQEDISFKIAPKINAVGRIYHPDLALGLLSEKDPDEADKIAKHVIQYNNERKTLQKKIELEAEEYVKNDVPLHGMLVYDKEWHIGVVGIVASRLVDEFHKPAIVIGNHNGVWKGSGRSLPGVNIKHILDDCQEMFVSYGGHAAAVGMTIKDEYIKDAGKIFDSACAKHYKSNEIELKSIRFFDACLGPKAITIDTAQSLRKSLYPYCTVNNPEPVFLIRDVVIYNVEVRNGENWQVLKFNLQKNGEPIEFPFKMFSSKFGSNMEGQTVDVLFSFPQLYEIKPNKYSQFELNVIDIIEK